jgi:uncharacterized protein YjbI with pentapeptide repeats
LSKTTLSKTTLSKTTLSKTTLSKTTLSKKNLCHSEQSEEPAFSVHQFALAIHPNASVWRSPETGSQ